VATAALWWRWRLGVGAVVFAAVRATVCPGIALAAASEKAPISTTLPAMTARLRWRRRRIPSSRAAAAAAWMVMPTMFDGGHKDRLRRRLENAHQPVGFGDPRRTGG
jgi:hypothetical protein